MMHGDGDDGDDDEWMNEVVLRAPIIYHIYRLPDDDVVSVGIQRTTYLLSLKSMLKCYQFHRMDLTDVAHIFHFHRRIQYQNDEIENCCSEILCALSYVL